MFHRNKYRVSLLNRGWRGNLNLARCFIFYGDKTTRERRIQFLVKDRETRRDFWRWECLDYFDISLNSSLSCSVLGWFFSSPLANINSKQLCKHSNCERMDGEGKELSEGSLCERRLRRFILCRLSSVLEIIIFHSRLFAVFDVSGRESRRQR